MAISCAAGFVSRHKRVRQDTVQKYLAWIFGAVDLLDVHVDAEIRPPATGASAPPVRTLAALPPTGMRSASPRPRTRFPLDMGYQLLCDLFVGQCPLRFCIVG